MRISRPLSGAWGIVVWAILSAALMFVLVRVGLPPKIVWGAGVFLGLLLVLRIVSVVRGSRRRPQGFSAFEDNALGRPATEIFRPPFHRDLPFEPDEKILAQAAPIMAVLSGWKDIFKGGKVEFMGRARVADAENALVLTDRRFFFVMLGPKELQRHGGDPGLVRLLEALPGRADEKRRMIWHKGEEAAVRALEGLLAESSLEEIQERLYSFTIPLEEIKSFTGSLKSRSLILGLKGRTLRYAFKNAAQLGTLSETLARLA